MVVQALKYPHTVEKKLIQFSDILNEMEDMRGS